MNRRWLRAGAALFVCASLFLLCACRSISLSDGTSFSIQRTQSPEGKPPSASAAVLQQSPAPAPSASEIPLPVQDDTHLFVSQQSQSVQTLFWMLYEAVENFETRVTLPEGTTRADVDRVDDLLYNDCPELYYLSHLSTYYFMQSTPDIITEVEIAYEMTKEEYTQAEPQVEAVVSKWIAATNGFSDYEKELYVHDELIRTCSYELEGEHTGSVYGALVLGKARCQGYANAMNFVLRRMEIPCLYLYGAATSDAGTESHAWNAVCLDGEWTLLDATWDDPMGSEETLSHAYFNLTDRLMAQSHSLDPAFALGTVPECDDLSMNYCLRSGNFIMSGEDALQETQERLTQVVQHGGDHLTLQFGLPEQTNQVVDALEALMQAAGTVDKQVHSWVYSMDNKANYLDISEITYYE